MTTVCLTFDFDAVALWVSTFKQTSATPVSRGEYGARVGLGRVLDLLTAKAIPATFFVPAHTAVSFPDETRRIAALGHEIGLHGDCHESPVGLDLAEEARLLDRAADRLRGVLGEGFRSLGYRSPAWDLSAHTVGLLADRGLVYDSSMMADDFRPYRARRGDNVDENRLTRGDTTDLVEMPVAWELDDFPYFAHLSRPLYGPPRSPDEVLALWQAEFDFCHEEVSDGVFTLTLHPQIIGRGPRIQMLGRLIDHMQAQPGVTFRTLADEAQRQHTRLPHP